MSHLNGELVSALSGELDLAGADPLRARITELVAAADGGRVVFDLSSVSFKDSTGVRVLCQLHDALQATGGPGLVLTGLQPCVRRLFDLIGASESIGRSSTSHRN